MYNQRRIFILGCGSVSRCMLPLLLKHIDVPASLITIMDFVDNKESIKHILAQGVRYVQDKLTEENYHKILPNYLSKGDLFIDLAWNTGTCDMLEWCHENGVLYVNTSVEHWDPYKDAEKKDVTELTLYHRQMEIRKLINKWGSNNGPTAVLDHGANPGLVSSFTKQALIDISQKILSEKPHDKRNPLLLKALQEKDFAQLAHLTGVKTIHISERDTQITHKPKEVNEFVNTWSIAGFIEEGIAPAEMGWGSHEERLPHGAIQHSYGPLNQICLRSKGMNTWVRSWVPSGEIIGMVIRHGEAFGLSEYLTVWGNDKAVYRPTVHYAYCPCDAAINSMHELEMNRLVPQEKQRILNDEIMSGTDELGCLLMGHDFNSWWIGSVLDISEARTLVPGQNATTIQVAIGVIAAIDYALKNPSNGICLPESLDHEEVLRIAKPYLGKFISQSVDWSPLHNADKMLHYGESQPSHEDGWQFKNFLVSQRL